MNKSVKVQNQLEKSYNIRILGEISNKRCHKSASIQKKIWLSKWFQGLLQLAEPAQRGMDFPEEENIGSRKVILVKVFNPNPAAAGVLMQNDTSGEPFALLGDELNAGRMRVMNYRT